MEKFVYKILTVNEWELLKTHKIFFGGVLDRNSGFIHLSSKSQLIGTIKKHYSKKKVVIVLKLMNLLIHSNVKWERSRNSDFFPHLFSILNLRHVLKFSKLDLRKNNINNLVIR